MGGRAAPLLDETPDLFGDPVLVRPRLGQGSFRFAMLDAYGHACAVTGEHSLPALEAAHIRPVADGGRHSLGNGLLLRADIHRLYDKGFVTVTADHRFRVSPALDERWSNGRVYYALDGATANVPADPDSRPDRELLDWHHREVFVAG